VARLFKDFTGAGAMKRLGATLILDPQFETRVTGKLRP
jgi:hypothetical protein